MRKEFTLWLEKLGRTREDLIFLTGDLGYAALEKVAEAMGPRFVNVGVAEQNMVSLAASLAQQGLSPMCYSIAPFTTFRPAEQIRLDVCIHRQNVKIVGNGGGYGYGIMGATHHALEDLAVLSSFPHLTCYVPVSNEDVAQVGDAMMARKGPAYLRLGFGNLPASVKLPAAYQAVRQLVQGTTEAKLTVVGIGPVLLNAIAARDEAGLDLDLFAVSELPLPVLSAGLVESLRRTGKLLVVEEHVRRGGLAESLALSLLQLRIPVKIAHHHAQGYPNGLYGNQAYHQAQSGLDSASLKKAMVELIHD